MSQRVLLPLLLITAGLILLGYSLWARRGGSRAARHWMDAPPAENWMLERIVLLGAPVAGLGLLAVAGIAVAPELAVLRSIVGGVLLVLLLPGLYFLIAPIPLPLVLYPAWAREPVRRRRRFWREQKARRR